MPRECGKRRAACGVGRQNVRERALKDVREQSFAPSEEKKKDTVLRRIVFVHV
jgi:hypothetical protein